MFFCIKWKLRQVKGFFLRGKRGYSQYDWWNAQEYWDAMIGNMLKQLADDMLEIAAEHEHHRIWRRSLLKFSGYLLEKAPKIEDYTNNKELFAAEKEHIKRKEQSYKFIAENYGSFWN